MWRFILASRLLESLSGIFYIGCYHELGAASKNILPAGSAVLAPHSWSSSSGFIWSCIVPDLSVAGEKGHQLTFDSVIFLSFFFFLFKIFLHLKLMGHLMIRSFAGNTFWRKMPKAFSDVLLFLYV